MSPSMGMLFYIASSFIRLSDGARARFVDAENETLLDDFMSVTMLENSHMRSNHTFFRRRQRSSTAACTQQAIDEHEGMQLGVLGLEGNVRCISTGSYGIVYEVNGFAVKIQIIKPEIWDGAYNYLNEVAAMEKFKAHDEFADIYNHKEDDAFGYIQMQLAEADYSSYLQANRARMMPHDFAKQFLDIATGISVLHAEGFVHRDLKAANVLMISDRPKVHDMAGVCRSTSENPAITTRVVPTPDEIKRKGFETFFGTCFHIGRQCEGMYWEYMAPETLEWSTRPTQNGSCQQYFPPSVDIWNLGLVLFEALGWAIDQDLSFETMLQWAINVASKMRGEILESANAGPTDDALLRLDARFHGGTCVFKLLRGMLEPMSRRLNLKQVLELAKTWAQGTPCDTLSKEMEPVTRSRRKEEEGF